MEEDGRRWWSSHSSPKVRGGVWRSATANLGVFQETGTARAQLKYVPLFFLLLSFCSDHLARKKKKKQMKAAASMSIWLTILATPLGVCSLIRRGSLSRGKLLSFFFFSPPPPFFLGKSLITFTGLNYYSCLAPLLSGRRRALPALRHSPL